MSLFLQLMIAETLKLRRSSALRMAWILPIVFLVFEFAFFTRTLLSIKEITPASHTILKTLPIKVIALLWAGFFHPLLLSIMPSLVFRPEHRSNSWKHLHSQPVPRHMLFLAKATMLLFLFGLSLGLVGLCLKIEWALIAYARPELAFPFPWQTVYLVLGWSFLGSLPLLALYLWLSDRINNVAVPVAFGLIGLVLTIALSGAEVDPSWRKDLIPWVLPYVCAQHPIEQREVRQDSHAAGTTFPQERDLSAFAKPRVWISPGGRKVTQTTIIPSYLLTPPAPTPTWLLVTFSLGAGVVFIVLGLIDSRRDRA